MKTPQQMLNFYIEAEISVLAGKEVQKGDRKWTRENLAEIRKGRQEWERKVAAQTRGAGPALAEFS